MSGMSKKELEGEYPNLIVIDEEPQVQEGNVGADKGSKKEEKSKTTGLFGHIIFIIGILFSIAIIMTFAEYLSFTFRVVVIWLISAFYLILTAKSKSGVIERMKIRIKRFEGKSLGIEHQILVLMFFVDIIIQHWIVRVLIIAILPFLIAIWIKFGLIVVSLLTFLILLVPIYFTAQYLKENVKTIKADPPHLGLLTVMGRRFNIVFKEGYALTIPGVVDFIEIDVQRKNHDFKVTAVYSKGNIPVDLQEVSLYSAPDPERLMDYVESGKEKGIMDTLEDIIPDDLRIWAKNYEIEGLLSAKREVVQKIIEDLTGIPERDITVEKLKNGIPDARLLGIKVYRFTIGPIEAKGEYGNEMERIKLEELQRIYETYETKTEVEQAKVIQEELGESGVNVPLEKCLRIVKDYKAQKEGRPVIPGLGDLLSSGAISEILKLLKK